MRRALTAALLAVLLQGCFATRQTPPPPPNTLPTAGEILESMRDRRERLKALRTLARVRYRSPSGTENARNVVAIERPDRIRIEIVSILGSLLVMTSNAGTFSAYVPRESTVYRGAASARNLAAYLPISVSVPAIIDHIMATPRFGGGGRPAVDWVGNLIRLTQTDATGGWEALFRDLDTLARYREIDRQGSTTVEALYEEFDDSGAIPIAKKVTLHFPATAESLEISMREPEINPSLPNELFSITRPPQTRRDRPRRQPLATSFGSQLQPTTLCGSSPASASH